MPVFNVGSAYNKTYLPPDVYDFLITDYKRYKNEKGEWFNIGFRVLDHPEFRGKMFYENFSISSKGIWKLEKLLLAAGMTEKQFDTDDDVFMTTHLKDKKVRLRIINQKTDSGTRQGIDRNGFFNITDKTAPLPGFLEQKPPTTDVRQLLEEEDVPLKE